MSEPGNKAPEPELPDLKKKRDERKRAGAVWSGPRGSGPGFAGARGGNGAASAARAAASGGQVGAELGESYIAKTILGQVLTRMGATLGGKLLIAFGSAVFLSGAILGAYRLFAGPATVRTGGAPELGGISASIRYQKGGASRALDFLRGQLKDPAPPPPPVAKVAPPKAEAAPEPTEAAPKSDWGDAIAVTAPTDLMANNLSGAKLTTALGGQFGGKNIFEGANATRFGEQGFDRNKLARFSVEKPKALKKLTPSKSRARAGRAASGQRRGVTRRALGQLRLARTLSGAAAQSTGEGAKTLAADAFDQRITDGGAPPLMPGETMGQTVQPLGPGAPNPNINPNPPTPGHKNMTPYQRDLDSAVKLGAQAGDMKKMSMMLMILGAALIAAGAALLSPPTTAIGAALIAIGGLLIGIAIMMLMMAMMMAKQAKQMADMIDQQYGQDAQGEILHECVDQAIADGTQPENCQPKTETDPLEGDLGDTPEEMANESYELEGGAPVKPQAKVPKN